MYYLGTYNQVNYYIDKVDKGENYNGTTNTWDKPIKHLEKDLYAVVKHNNYNHSSMTLVDTLPDGWVNNEHG